MKQIATLYLLFLLPIFSFAQIQKGSWLIGGTLDWNYNQVSIEQDIFTSNTNISLTNFSGHFGYFLNQNIAIGLGGNYSQLDRKFDSEINDFSDNSIAYGAELFVRSYLNKGKSRFYLIASSSYQKQKSRFENFVGSDIREIESFNVFGGLGLNFFLTPNIALDGLLRYKFAESFLSTLEPESPNFFTTMGIQFFLNANQNLETPIRDKYLQKGNYVLQLQGNGNTKLKETPYRLSLNTGLKYFVTEYWQMGGTLGFETDNFDNDVPRTYSIEGGLSSKYFLKLNQYLFFAPEIELGYTHQFFSFWAFTLSGMEKLRSNTYQISLFPELLYFFSPKSIVKFGFRLNQNWQSQKAETDFTFPPVNSNAFSLGIQTGAEFFVSQNISFEVILGWQFSDSDFEQSGFESRLDRSSSSDLRFGINYFIESKK